MPTVTLVSMAKSQGKQRLEHTHRVSESKIVFNRDGKVSDVSWQEVIMLVQ